MYLCTAKLRRVIIIFLKPIASQNQNNMKKKVAKFSILPILSGAIFFSFSTKEAANLEGYATSSLEPLEYTVPNSV